ncbi:hypothetical protein AAGF08_01855 [Algoriphagus sp. SE2]|uniref:hypothetical protein n=1 Tax=Algoriphagus sp. SE2 TaxID=3141536 RepID=UPI0031CD4060
MKNKHLIVLFTFCWVINTSLLAQNSEMLHVVNFLGASIYSAPSFDSQLIGLVEAGNKVYVNKSLERKVKKQVSADLGLEGNWLEIILDSSIGYIFSGDFTAKLITKDADLGSFEELNLFGKELEKKEFTEQTIIDGNSYPVQKIVRKYESAVVYETFFDGCHDTEYLLESFSLSEAYHQLINLTGRKFSHQFEIPRISSREGNIWNFSDLDAIQNLKLQDLGGGKFKITFYSCT